MMVVLGVVGAIIGGYVAASVLDVGSVNGINPERIVIATLGAVALFVFSFAGRSRGFRLG